MREEYAFQSASLPCNSLPFIDRLREILKERETNSLDLLRNSETAENRVALRRAKAVMWVLMSQLYGQGGTVDLYAEYDELNRLYTQGVF